MADQGVLDVKALRKSFGALEVLKGVDLRCVPGSIQGLIGRNGSGKSTLLSCISGRINPDAGTLYLDDRALPDEAAWKRARRGIAWTFQDTSLSLTSSVADLLTTAESRGFSDRGSVPKELKDTTESFQNLAWNTLSFGQRKVAALLIAISRRPRVLLLDEPVSGLSMNLIELVGRALRTFADDGAVVMVVEHDREFLRQTVDSVAVLSCGAIVLTGGPDAVFDDPRTLDALI